MIKEKDKKKDLTSHYILDDKLLNDDTPLTIQLACFYSDDEAEAYTADYNPDESS